MEGGSNLFDFDQSLKALDEFQFIKCIGDMEESEEQPGEEDELIAVNATQYYSRKVALQNSILGRCSYCSNDQRGIFGGKTYYSTLNGNGTVRDRLDSPDEFQLKWNPKNNGKKKVSQEGLNLTLTNWDSESEDLYDFSMSLIVFLAGLVTKAFGFHFNLFISFFTFPMWLMYSSFVLLIDPFRVVKWARKRTIDTLLTMWDSVSERFNGRRSFAKLAIRICWGLFWAVYVYFLLLGVLVSGFIIGGVVMRYMVEEPIQITENLNFDYTKSSPVALVPITSCPSVSCGANCEENIEIRNYIGSRVVPPNNKLQLALSLALPESDHNRKLGVFQVKVDYLSSSGKVISSTSYPCMLRFKSELLHYIETFLNSLPLLAGYSTESQILNLRTRGFTEREDPTSCIKVTIEQRAKYRAGASTTGVPEIYRASLVLDSELPLIKRFIWLWRKTIYVWTSIVLFVVETLLILVCCRPVIFPRPRRDHGSSKGRALGYAIRPLIKGS